MQNDIAELKKMQSDIAELKKMYNPNAFMNIVTNRWVPEKQLKDFVHYEPTQMASLLKSRELVVSKIGKRKFILKQSIEDLLNKNILKPKTAS